jgi:large subunit ribosomal protein L4
MAKLELFSLSGKSEGQIEASDSLFNAAPNEHIVKETLTWFLASNRQGNASSKTRGEVSGGGKKPWRQKGTGRARIGDNRAPHWRHGGVTFGPKPRDYSFALPIKIRRAALRVVLSDKARSGKIKVVENITLASQKTKEMVKLLKTLGIKGSSMIIVASKDNPAFRTAANIKDVKVSLGRALNVFDLLKYDEVVMLKESLPVIEEALK